MAWKSFPYFLTPAGIRCVRLYLRQPELLDPRLQHVLQSTVHLLGVLDLTDKDSSNNLTDLFSWRLRACGACAVTTRGQQNPDRGDRHQAGPLRTTAGGFHLCSWPRPHQEVNE
ncbi:hypothetical protein INR49_018356 [Caranx melampygus]|nr:hypothetical protein INR49_018356 [Caranx melampygus]